MNLLYLDLAIRKWTGPFGDKHWAIGGDWLVITRSGHGKWSVWPPFPYMFTGVN